MVDSLLDDVRSRITDLENNDFKPFLVLFSPEVYANDIPIDENLDIDTGVSSIISDLERDFVVCFEDNKEDSPLAMPSPNQVRNEIVDNLEFTELEPDVAHEHGYEKVKDGDMGLMIELFADVYEKGVSLNGDNLNSIDLTKDDVPLDEEVVEADDAFQEPIELGVVSSDLENRDNIEEKELLKQELKEALTEEIIKTLYRGEFAYPYRYQPSEKAESVRIGKEFFRFDKVMMPEVNKS